jgi:restriction endonuclease S subunit
MNEADTCTRLIRPKIEAAGWDNAPHLFNEQFSFTDGRIVVAGSKVRRRKRKIADFLLRFTRDLTLGVVEAKSDEDPAGTGMQQAKDYAEILGLKFAYATNGNEIIEFDYFTGQEAVLPAYPTPDELWARYKAGMAFTEPVAQGLLTPSYPCEKGRRYYHQRAINGALAAILQGKKRVLLTMATGTGKTIVAFHICWRLWSQRWNRTGEHRRPKILFLADRNVLVDDPMAKDFKPFGELPGGGDARFKIEHGHISKGREMYFAIYQAIAKDEWQRITLPSSLEKQQRLVAKIDALATKIEEAKRIRDIVLTELAALRDQIFRSSFQGTLIPRGPRNEGASELLIKIRSEKQKLAAQTKMAPGKSYAPVTNSEKPHPIPKTWEWVRLDELCSVITDGTHLTPTYVDDGRPFLSAQNVKPYRFMPANYRKVTEDVYQSCVVRAKPEKGDILMTRVGAMIGEAAIIDKDLDFAYYVSLCLLKPLREHVWIPYVTHWLNSPYGTASARSKTLGRGHSQGNLNLNLIRQFVLPLPPLKEQQQIACYLDEIQSRIDAAKQLQEEASEENAALLPAILDRAFKGAL